MLLQHGRLPTQHAVHGVSVSRGTRLPVVNRQHIGASRIRTTLAESGLMRVGIPLYARSIRPNAEVFSRKGDVHGVQRGVRSWC